MFEFPLYHWHLEISTKCMLKCPRCPRTTLKGKYDVGELSLDHIKQMFSQKEFAEKALKVTFCGGQGDPIYHSQFLDVIRFFKSFEVPKIVTIITNGSYKNRQWWEELRGLLTPGDDVTFSIDGLDQESNEKYRVNSDWDSIMLGMEVMAGGPALVFWNAIYFSFNESRMAELEALARKMNVDALRLTHSELFGSKYPAYIDSNLGIDPLEPSPELVAEHQRMFKVMKWFNKERHNSLGPPYRPFHEARREHTKKVLETQFAQNAFPNCLFGFRGNYVDVNGIFYPCSWVSHPMPIVPDNAYQASFLKDKDLFDLKKHSIQEVLKHGRWEELFKTWTDQSQPLMLECGMKCTKEKFPTKTLENFLRPTP